MLVEVPPPPLASDDPDEWGVYADMLMEGGDANGAYAKCVSDTLKAFRSRGEDRRRLLLLRVRPPEGEYPRRRPTWRAFVPRGAGKVILPALCRRHSILWASPKGASDFYRLGLTDAEVADRVFAPWDVPGFADAAQDAVWSYFRRLLADAQHKGWVKYDNSWVGPQ